MSVIYGPDGGVLSVVGEPAVRTCWVCGCTDDNACSGPNGACAWVEADKRPAWVEGDLCSACVEEWLSR